MARPRKTPSIDISVILPSRDRVGLLSQLLASIISTTDDIRRIEVLIAVDKDDVSTIGFLEKYCLSSRFVRYFIVDRSSNFSKDYYNYLYGISTGKYVMAINDDCEFMTVGWDTELLKAMDGMEVVYGVVEDGVNASLRGVSYSCWPLLGRVGVERLGYFFPSRISTWGGDIWAAMLYRAVGAVVDVPVLIQHICHHNGTRERDNINYRVGALAGVYSVEPTAVEVSLLKGNIVTREVCL